MQQELPQLFAKRRKNAVVFICKAAFYTIPRFGVLSILLLSIGLFYIFQACNTFLQLREEKLVPWELLGSISDKDIDLEKLLYIDGIERISPVIQFDTEIQLNEYKLSCQIQAVYSVFVDGVLSEGSVYVDNSNMPFLLINKSALELLSIDNSTQENVIVDTSVNMIMNNETTKAIICGILDDEKEIPVAYMSYDFAKKTLVQEEITTLLVALSNKGCSEQVALSLEDEGVSVTYEENEIIRWTFMEQQIIQFVLTSFVLLACSAILIRKHIYTEDKTEIQALLMSGLTKVSVNNMINIRFWILYIICFIISNFVAVVWGISSFLAVLVCFTVSFLHFWLIRL